MVQEILSQPFYLKDLKVIKANNFEQDKHISLILKSKTGFSIKSISFNSVNTVKLVNIYLTIKMNLNVVGQINENIWNNNKNSAINNKGYYFIT